jgi:hypothetical protein
MSYPTSLPPSEAQHLRNLAAQIPRSQQGRYVGSQPTQPIPHRTSTPNVAASSSGSAVLSAVHYIDNGSSTANFYQAAPSSLLYYDGEDPSPYVAYAGTGTGAPGLKMLVDGWYQVYAYAQISGLTNGDNAQMTVNWSSAGFDLHSFTEKNNNDYALQCTSVPSYHYTNGFQDLITVSIDNPAGGTINSVTVSVLKLRD